MIINKNVTYCTRKLLYYVGNKLNVTNVEIRLNILRGLDSKSF